MVLHYFYLDILSLELEARGMSILCSTGSPVPGPLLDLNKHLISMYSVPNGALICALYIILELLILARECIKWCENIFTYLVKNIWKSSLDLYSHLVVPKIPSFQHVRNSLSFQTDLVMLPNGLISLLTCHVTNDCPFVVLNTSWFASLFLV